MVVEAIGAATVLGIAYALSKRLGYAPKMPLIEGAEPRKLAPKYAPGTEEPAPLPPSWAAYAGARPELRGAPTNTILAVRGLEKRSPEFRAMLLDLAEKHNIPVDTLATVMSSESGLNPQAENPLPAAGLLQLTRGANLKGFTTDDAIRGILKLSAEEQLEQVWDKYLGRFKASRAWNPGEFYMRNFLPDKANLAPGDVIGRKDEKHVDGPKAGKPTFAALVYQWNPGFDKAKKGTITLQDVYDVAASQAKGAKGQRMTVDGRMIGARASKGIAGAMQHGATGLSPAKQNADGSLPLLMDANGLLLKLARDRQIIEPFWKTIGVFVGTKKLLIDVTGDALQAHVAISITEKDLANLDVATALGALLLVSGLDLSKPTVLSRAMRIPCAYRDAIEIAKMYNAICPTKWIWDGTYDQAFPKLRPAPLEASKMMSTLLYVLMHDQLINTQLDDFGGREANRAELVRDVGKGWILHPRLTEKGAVNYGWLRYAQKELPEAERLKPIQSPGAAHGPTHVDYSQTCCLVRREATFADSGKRFDLLDWIGSAEGRKATGETIEKRFLDAFR